MNLMLFNPRPKEKKEDMFGRDNKISELETHIKNKKPLILIKGLRRTGKTSLIKTALNEKVPANHIFIDLRGLGSRVAISRKEVYDRFLISINNFLSKNEGKLKKIMGYLERINSISIMGNGIGLSDKNSGLHDLISIFGMLNEWIEKDKDFPCIVLAIDEAQLFNELKDSDMTEIIASIYDNCKNIVIILSGSQIGLLDKFVGKIQNHSQASSVGNSHALRGFHKEIVDLPHLKPDQSKEFLRRGFNQLGDSYSQAKDFEEIISKVVDNFDGVIGWLNNFGVICGSKGKISESYISDVQTEGFLTVKEEFGNFLELRELGKIYQRFMEALAVKSLKWEEIENYLRSKKAKFTVEKLQEIKNDLIEHGFIDWDSNTCEYSITDPLYRKYFLR